MIKTKNTYLRVGMALCVFIPVAIACRILNDTDTILRNETGILLGLIRSSIYIGIFAAWGFSVRHRIVSQKTRGYLTASAAFLVLWNLLKTVKYYFVSDPDINRMLWYSYYIPILFIPLLSVMISASIGKPGSQPVPKKAIPPIVVTVLLTGLVLTNDFHQLVFRFPEDAAVFTDESYGYAPGFTLTAVWAIGCALVSVGVMIYKCRLPKTGRVLWLPFVPMGAAVLYGVLYANGVSLVVDILPDMTVFLCLMYAACFESFIACGLIQSNTNYIKLFTSVDFPVCITDKAYNVRMESMGGAAVDRESFKKAESWPFMAGNVRLSKSDIRGGHAVWADDVSNITDAISELQDVNKTLSERHALIREESRTNMQKVRLTEANRLYNMMQFETAPQIDKMQELTEELSREEDPEKQKLIITRLVMIGAYFKRRNNLLFVSQTRSTIRAAELGHCVRESLSSLDFLGVSGEMIIEGERGIPLSESIRIYDALEAVLEEVFSRISAIAVIVREKDGGHEMRVGVHIRDASPLCDIPPFEAEREDENEYVLTCFIPEKEEKDQ